MPTKLTLEELVTQAATDLMGVTAITLRVATQNLLRELVDYFGVDSSFLRRNDHRIRASILVAEWPPRVDVPSPDPLEVVFFEGADPTFAASEHLSHVTITRPGELFGADVDDSDYQDLVRRASGVQVGVSLAVVPLLSIQDTMGVLGFVKYGDRAWSDAEMTGLANRRALVDHLDDRLRPGQPGPVGLVFMDVDRLKALNNFFGHAAGDQYLQTLATRLRDRVSADHLLARLGGDEFVLVMSGASGE